MVYINGTSVPSIAMSSSVKAGDWRVMVAHAHTLANRIHTHK